jgi:hypothetical protein
MVHVSPIEKLALHYLNTGVWDLIIRMNNIYANLIKILSSLIIMLQPLVKPQYSLINMTGRLLSAGTLVR